MLQVPIKCEENTLARDADENCIIPQKIGTPSQSSCVKRLGGQQPENTEELLCLLYWKYCAANFLQGILHFIIIYYFHSYLALHFFLSKNASLARIFPLFSTGHLQIRSVDSD